MSTQIQKAKEGISTTEMHEVAINSANLNDYVKLIVSGVELAQKDLKDTKLNPDMIVPVLYRPFDIAFYLLFLIPRKSYDLIFIFEVDAHINDDEFAEVVANEFSDIIRA